MNRKVISPGRDGAVILNKICRMMKEQVTKRPRRFSNILITASFYDLRAEGLDNVSGSRIVSAECFDNGDEVACGYKKVCIKWLLTVL